jgi:hypothetical protein
MFTKKMKDQIKKSGTLLASIGTLGGFIADVLTPLGPFTKWIFIIFIILTIALFIFYLKNRSFGKKYLPISLIFSTIFGFLFLINGDSKSGVLGDNIDGISSMQKSLFNLQESVDRIENKIDVVSDKLDLGFDKIEELIKLNNPIENPTSPKDHMVNAYLYMSSGLLKKSQFSFEEYFRLTNDFKVDVLLDYSEVFESNNGFISLKKQLSLFPINDVTRLISLVKNSLDKKELIIKLLNDSLNEPNLVKWFILTYDENPFGSSVFCKPNCGVDALGNSIQTHNIFYNSGFLDYAHFMFTAHVSLGYNCENVHHYFFNNLKARDLILTNNYTKQPFYTTVIDWKALPLNARITEMNDYLIDSKYIDDPVYPFKYENNYFPQDQYPWSNIENQKKADDLEKLYLLKWEEGWFR